MARPKDTKTTKWLIKHESWYPSRAEAVSYGKSSKLPYEVENKEGSKTYYGNYRKSTWRLRTFIPKLYRGQKMRAGPWTTNPKDIVKRYHNGYPLVKIRGGAWIVLEGTKESVSRNTMKTRSIPQNPIGTFLLQTKREMNKLVRVHKSDKGSFYIIRNHKKVYVHEVGWGYRDMDAHKKNKKSYQVVRIGSNREPKWVFRSV